jgi:hypothetical protein
MMLDQLTAVLVVLALIAGLAWGVRRLQGGVQSCVQTGIQSGIQTGLQGVRLPVWLGARAAGPMRERAPLSLTSQISLTAQHRLHRIETGEGDILLLVTYPGGVTVVPSNTSTNASTNASGKPELAT